MSSQNIVASSAIELIQHIKNIDLDAKQTSNGFNIFISAPFSMTSFNTISINAYVTTSLGAGKVSVALNESADGVTWFENKPQGDITVASIPRMGYYTYGGSPILWNASVGINMGTLDGDEVIERPASVVDFHQGGAIMNRGRVIVRSQQLGNKLSDLIIIGIKT